MQLAAPSRRALGLAAVGAIATSTTLLSLGGVAQAITMGAVETTTPTFGVSYDYDGGTDTWTVPAGYCAVDWHLEGAQGGAGSGVGEDGGLGGSLDITTYIDDTTVATTFTMAPGQAGSDASSDGLTGGAGGLNHLAADVDGDYDGGDGWSDDDTIAGGGGGAASTVTGSDDSELIAFGGNGGGDADYYGYGAWNDSNYVYATTSEPQTDGVADGGDGFISATAYLCAPAEPTLDWLEGDDGKLIVHFSEGEFGDAPTTGYQYTLDNGTTWTTLTTSTVDGEVVGTISGRTNGTTYTVAIRSIAANGAHSEATDPETAMAYKRIGVPPNVVATAGPSSIVITWDAPTTAGTYPLAGYIVGGSAREINGPNGADGIACETAADVRRCVVTAEPGWSYSFSVTSVDTEDNPGFGSAMVTVSDVQRSSVPATVPTKDGDLVRPAGQSGSVAPGSTVRVTGGGYLPGSTVTLIAYSTPQVLTTTVADGSGNIDVTVTVPAGLAAGNHTLVAAGVDAQGNTHYLTLPITVTGGTTGSGGLAYTGADIAVPAIGGLAALAIGGGFVLAGRRKRTAE
ncbi:fibronectin type III domain-containing protein [Blastococcus sp. URHD0036]|uniref:fibronectin type III domain-containing protein n=1 Tax=Blastococcus sp. URHD0036 TaxID=1380356 RepID=UPI000497E0DC|nr:fibronectin type III domain-containing protein [Blastococcus sp. URHD0036]